MVVALVEGTTRGICLLKRWRRQTRRRRDEVEKHGTVGEVRGREPKGTAQERDGEEEVGG